MLSLEYIAGFADGEGSFCISRLKNDKYQARVSMSNTCHDVLRMIQYSLEMCEVAMYLYRMKVKPPRAPQWSLETNRRSEALKLCIMLQPYLVVKAEEAITMIKFLQCEDPDEMYMLYRLCRRLKWGNKRGKY